MTIIFVVLVDKETYNEYLYFDKKDILIFFPSVKQSREDNIMPLKVSIFIKLAKCLQCLQTSKIFIHCQQLSLLKCDHQGI